jgi:hypothetical protein
MALCRLTISILCRRWSALVAAAVTEPTGFHFSFQAGRLYLVPVGTAPRMSGRNLLSVGHWIDD